VSRKNQLPYYGVAVAVQLVWGITPSASRIVLDYLPVEVYSAIRYTFAGLLFLGITRLRHRRFAARIEILPKLVVLGIFTYALDSIGTLYGLKIGGVLSFALASSLNALVTAVVSLLVLKEKAARGFLLAVALSITGGLLLFLGKSESTTVRIAGTSLLLIWAAYLCEALGFVFSRRYRALLPLEEYLGILQLSAGLVMLVTCLITAKDVSGVLTMPWKGWAALGFVCVVACGICYFLLYWLLNFIDGHRLAFFDAFHTISAAVLGVILFQESFNTKMIAGGALLLLAVWVMYVGDRRNDVRSS